MLSSQLPQDGGKHGEFHEYGPIATLGLLLLEAHSLIKSSIVWNTVMVFKAFCKSLDCSFGRSIVCRRSKSVSRVSSIPVGTNTTPSMTEAVQCGITPWNGAVSGVQHGSLLAEGAFGSVCSQVGFGEWKCVLLSPWITSIPAVATS